MPRDPCCNAAQRAAWRIALGALVGLALVHGAVPVFGQARRGRVAVLSGAHDTYRASAEALVARLRNAGHECTLLELPSEGDSAIRDTLQQLADFKPDVIAAAGTSATTSALNAVHEVPVVFFMVPNALDAPFMAADFAARDRVVGITSDIDPDQQVDWIVRTSPHTKKVAVLHTSRTKKTAAALQKAGRERRFTVELITASRREFPKAVEALENGGCDGVLMLPDADVYDSPSVQRLLLWGVRQQKRVWTFSPNIVKAGAFSGLYCDSKKVGQEAARIVQDVLDGKKPGAIGLRYPSSMDRAVNVHTAKMIDEALSQELLASGVVRMGEQP